MTTREEYAEAAEHCGSTAAVWQFDWPERFSSMELAARVLRALADGAVLCRRENVMSNLSYRPLDPQP